jgi:DNA polymerase-1
MRTTIKTINFGLAYGASAHKIATVMQISLEEAEAIVKTYFEVFPKLEHTLTQLGAFGMVKGYIMTPSPYFRRRWFKEGPQNKALVQEHLDGDYKFKLGVIERASKNMPIQGGSGDMTKLALVKIRRHINVNKLSTIVKLTMQVHDQVDTICHKDYASIWQRDMTSIMESAAKVVIPSGLLTSETNITEKWTK